ncbi:jg3496 [Pararge aegeria aegeria]|uniref:Jg3496 protein n=1 Tax=Pararge aegeria aegeria TaxID=348720 RepID=A0A8S4SLA9_9NEOP|nr:jg3496 [Pararge aegeria aegeria]
MLGVSKRDQIRNEEILRRTRITDVAQRVIARRNWNGSPSAAFVDTQRGGQTTFSASQVEYGIPYKRPTSSCGVCRLI